MGNNIGPMVVNGEWKLIGKKTYRPVPETNCRKILSCTKYRVSWIQSTYLRHLEIW